MKDRILIKSGLIVDGTGAEPFYGDILIERGKIKEVSRKINEVSIKSVDKLTDEVCIQQIKASSQIEEVGSELLNQGISAYVIDATGKTITPGFTDIHRHCDYAALRSDFGAIELAQGITSAVSGSCGLTPFPLRDSMKAQLSNLLTPCLGACVHDELFHNYSDYANHLQQHELPINIGNMIGSCSVRIAVKGFAQTNYTRQEMDEAKSIVSDAMDAGALGVSMGIMYYPEYYSTKEELVDIASVVAKKNGILSCHIRGEGDGLVSSVEEIIEIAKRAEVSLQISHFKSCGKHNWNKGIYEAMERIERERDKGMDIHVDFYPYTGGATTLLSLIPPAFLRNTLQETWEYMKSDAAVKELEEKLNATYDDWDNYILTLGYDRIIITSVSLDKYKRFVGKTLANIIEEGNDPYRFLCDIMAEEQGMVGIIVMSMSGKDVDAVAKLPYSFVISDSLYIEQGNPHPRLYASFPKILRDYVLERKVLSLPEAVKKMTSMPADKLRLKNRGKIEKDYAADLAIFDLNNVKDNADFVNSNRLSTGMDYVLVGGQIAWRDETLVKKNGVYLRR